MKIVRIARGKTTVIAIGSRSKMNDRLKQLRDSVRTGVCGRRGRKYPVEYRIEDE